ncbi:MAG: hypothetical protein RL417_91, partial [Pseudomonadota bacterium]
MRFGRFTSPFLSIVFLVAYLCHAEDARGITIDTFGEAPEDGVQISSNTPGATRTGHFPSLNALGGGRSLSVIKIGSTFGSTEVGIY